MGTDSGTDDTLRATPHGSASTTDLPTLPVVDPAHYALGEELARGGMGRIVHARDRRLGRPVAIKELLHADPEARVRFDREARITARLQHPAIVNVIEAGSWPGGEPFYVMKLVAGESLDKVIAKRTTLRERIALVPEVLAVTRALAYAHGQRVIHRDLKPANVLVGEFGEIVVVDWGLAKDLAVSSDPDSIDPTPRRPVGKTPGATDATIAGSVMGTPAYMPAEQALGDPVDERADVYALGALLYHVLAGQPPYVGRTTEDILVNVITGPPQPLAERIAGVPPDLVAIVTKAMAHRPSDRYPSAKELADDLAKFTTGQLVGAHRYSAWQLVARWIRRHRAVVAVGSVALITVLVIGVLAVRRVVEARERAEDQRRRAEDLVGFMMTDLRDKLTPLGRLDLLDAMAKRSRDYYASGGAAADDPARRAVALANIGDLLRDEGDFAGALAQYRAAAALRETLPDMVALSIAYDRIGDVLLAQRDYAGALAVYTKSLALATSPHDLAVGHDKVGAAHVAHEDLDAARAEFATALAIRTASPDDAMKQRDLAAIHDRLGDIDVEQKHLDAALAHYVTSHAIAVELALSSRNPSDTAKVDLASSDDRLGDLLVDRDDPDGALPHYLESLAIRASLAAKDPANAAWQRHYSLALDDMGDVLLAKKQYPLAIGMYEQSFAIATKLAALDPTNGVGQRDVAWGHANLADAYADSGDLVTARERYGKAIALFAAMPGSDPAVAKALVEIRGKVAKLALPVDPR